MMKDLGLFRYLQPTVFSGLLDDPILYIHIRPTGRGILFDCGQIQHIAKRVLRSIDALFISHAHMDHFIGFDHLVRNIFVAQKALYVYGPAGIAHKIHSKLQGYDWNLVEDSWCTIFVNEVYSDRIEQFEIAGGQGFQMGHKKQLARDDLVIFSNKHLKVEAEICDHKIPTLIFRITETPCFCIDRQRLRDQGFLPGPWLKELQKRFYSQSWKGSLIQALKQSKDGVIFEKPEKAEALYHMISRKIPPASIGYIGDLGMTDNNVIRIQNLMAGVNILMSECTFLAEDKDRARLSFHLCTSDLVELCQKTMPAFLIPVHLSKLYISNPQRVYSEFDKLQGTRILKVPNYMTPRPSLPSELVLTDNEALDKHLAGI